MYINILLGGDKYLEGGCGEGYREGCLGRIYTLKENAKKRMCVLSIYIYKEVDGRRRGVRRWRWEGGDGETDISIAKGFDNQKGAAAAVTARRIRSFRNANLWTRHRRRRDDIATPADCRERRRRRRWRSLMEIVEREKS